MGSPIAVGLRRRGSRAQDLKYAFDRQQTETLPQGRTFRRVRKITIKSDPEATFALKLPTEAPVAIVLARSFRRPMSRRWAFWSCAPGRDVDLEIAARQDAKNGWHGDGSATAAPGGKTRPPSLLPSMTSISKETAFRVTIEESPLQVDDLAGFHDPPDGGSETGQRSWPASPFNTARLPPPAACRGAPML